MAAGGSAGSHGSPGCAFLEVNENGLTTPSTPVKRLHWTMAGLIIFGFAAPAAVVGVPYSIAMNGLLFGSLACVVVTLGSIGGSLLLLEIALAHPDCQTLGEIGSACMGDCGKILANTTQMTNFIGFLPVVLLINAQALKGVLDRQGDCTDYYILGVSLLCFLTTQVRTLTNTQTFSLISLTCVTVVTVFELYLVLSTKNPEKESAQLVGHPFKSDNLAGVMNMLLALTCTAWSYVPSFLSIELISAMPRPRDFKKSILLSGSMNMLLFIGLGCAVVSHWGWNLVDVVYLTKCWPSSHVLSRIMQGLLLTANMVSYTLDSVPLARFCQRAWAPNFKDDWSLSSIAFYALLSLPTYLFGVIASIVVGNLYSMLAFVTAFSVPWVTQIFPAMCYYRWRTDAWLKDESPLRSPLLHDTGTQEQESGARTGPLSWKEKVLIAFIFSVGVCSFVVCIVAAVGKVAIKELRGPTVIGCGSWTLYSDADQFPLV